MIIEQVDSPMLRTEDGNSCQLFWASEQNATESEKAGRPIHDRVLRIRVYAPGAKHNAIPVFDIERHMANGKVKVNQHIAARYAKVVNAYKTNSETPELSGTPLTSWPALDVARIADFKASGVHVIEALAAIPDSKLHEFPPDTRKYRDKAIAYLETAADNAPIEKLTSENAQLRGDLEHVKAQMADLISRLPADMAATAQAPSAPQPPDDSKRGPGRPRKAA